MFWHSVKYEGKGKWHTTMEMHHRNVFLYVSHLELFVCNVVKSDEKEEIDKYLSLIIPITEKECTISIPLIGIVSNSV